MKNGGALRRVSRRSASWAAAILLLLVAAGNALAATVPGTPIDNVAFGRYFHAGSDDTVSAPSNFVTVITVGAPAPSRLEFMRFDPGSPHEEELLLAPTHYSASGDEEGPFVLIPFPVLAALSGSETVVRVALAPTPVYHLEETVYLRLTDADRNLDTQTRESVVVEVRVDGLGDREILRLAETGEDTGVFAGYIGSGAGNWVTRHDGILEAGEDERLDAEYQDAVRPDDTSQDVARIDPVGLVFDSRTGLPVNGARITLVDAVTGLAATVFGDDGESEYPATVVSGERAEDVSGRSYPNEPGGYRYPVVAPGNYRLVVQPPVGYAGLSLVAAEQLQRLPGGPFDLAEPGSRGESFPVGVAGALGFDVPLDSEAGALVLEKSVSPESATIGDFIGYTLRIENVSPTPSFGVEITDALPQGFRYQAGSAAFDHGGMVEPTVSPDGSVLTFAVGDLLPGRVAILRYVVEVGAGSPRGWAVNRATAADTLGDRSNTAEASVRVGQDLFDRGVVFGRVTVSDCDSTGAGVGAPGVLILFEDGTVVPTDSEGRYHIEGVPPGTHVVQLDPASLPPGYEPALCDTTSWFAGRPASQFVSILAGVAWRADFTVRYLPVQGEVGLQLASAPDDGAVNVRADLDVIGIPVQTARLTLALPEGAVYRAGSSRLDGEPLADPEVNGTLLVYRLGGFEAGRAARVELEAALGTAPPQDAAVKAFVVFDAPNAPGLRSEVATSPLGGAPSTRIVVATQETLGAAAPTPETPAPRAAPGMGDGWLETLTEGSAWVWPDSGYGAPIPSLKLVVQHGPRDRVSVLLNGTEVSPRNFDGVRVNQAGTVAVTAWSGVDIPEGPSRLEAEIRHPDGTITRLVRAVHYAGSPVAAEIVASRSHLVADGRTPPVLAVRLTDRDGFPARPKVIGSFEVGGPHRSRFEMDAMHDNPLGGMGSAGPQYVVGDDGIARIELEPSNAAGEVVLYFQFEQHTEEVRAWLVPEVRDWILVGLAEGTVGYTTVSGGMESLESGAEGDELYTDGRLAFFAKGRVKGEWLLTLAYDSDGRPVGSDGLFRTIDPDTYYTLYGDATDQGYDVASARKLYLRLERRQFYALFGDYETGLDVTELSRYSRAMNGVKTEYQGSRIGYNAFAAETGSRFVRDEIRGDGTSGLYRFSRNDVMSNSETVVLQVRDRFRSEVILSERPQRRHLDYNIDYSTGTVFFRKPVPSKDPELNPVYVVVDYEVGSPVNGDIQAGGRASGRFLHGDLETGVTYVHQETGDLTEKLAGLDARVNLDRVTEVRAEVAWTEKNGAGDASAVLASVTRRGSGLDASAYYRRLEPGFGLGQQNMSERATEKFGLDLGVPVGPGSRVGGQAYRQINLFDDAYRDVGELSASHETGRFGLRAGALAASDHFEMLETRTSIQASAGGTVRLARDRLRLSADHSQSMGSRNDNTDFPTRTVLGADWVVLRGLSLFVAQEFTQGSAVNTNGTRVGLSAQPWRGSDIAGSLGREVTEYGPRIMANLGVQQAWQLNENWFLDVGLDHSHTLGTRDTAQVFPDVPPASGGEDFTAVSLGTQYYGGRWQWNARAEVREAGPERRWVFLPGMLFQADPVVGLVLGGRFFVTEGPVDRTYADLRLGISVRPRSSAWLVLDRLDLIDESRTDLAGETYESRRIVNNLDVNRTFDARTQATLHYGSKVVGTDLRGLSFSGYTDLLGLEVRRAVGSAWDVGLEGSLLHSWNARLLDHHAGVSIGWNVLENTWARIGYNVSGFVDEDFSEGTMTAHGPYLRLSVKLDTDLLSRFGLGQGSRGGAR